MDEKQGEKEKGFGKRPLWQWLVIYLVIGVVIFGVIFYISLSNRNASQTALTPSPDTSQTASQNSDQSANVTLPLEEVNNSGESGTAILEEREGKLVVTVNLEGFQNNPQPAHIHKGECPGVGEVLHPLNDVAGGVSITTLDIGMDQLMLDLPVAINVHKSSNDLKTYTSCATLIAP